MRSEHTWTDQIYVEVTATPEHQHVRDESQQQEHWRHLSSFLLLLLLLVLLLLL